MISVTPHLPHANYGVKGGEFVLESRELGRITKAEFGLCEDRPFLFGLKLMFEGQGWGVGDGGRFMLNISKACKWSEEERMKAITASADYVAQILADAKVSNVSQLVGKPVEITFENRTFKSFRILTEVL